jgi:hypothetical protein
MLLLPCDSRDGHSDPHLGMIVFVLGAIIFCLSYRKSRHEVACSMEGKNKKCFAWLFASAIHDKCLPDIKLEYLGAG